MCELLGMSFNLPVKPNISFTGFKKRGKLNPDGWGLAFYPDKSAQVFKKPITATNSPRKWNNTVAPRRLQFAYRYSPRYQ